MQSALTQLLRSAAVCCSLGCAGASLAQAAPGEPRERDAQRPAPAQPVAAPANNRVQPAAPRPADGARPGGRVADQRGFDARGDEARRQQLQQEQSSRSNDAFRRNGRLTADERRDLRRQINEAGQDIYPNTPRR